jgi:prepilin-type N-terminal cleavage/methylation domain-containing protein
MNNLMCRKARECGHNCGFTIVELLVCLVVAAVIAIFLVPLLSSPTRCGGRPIKDSTQVRGVHQGMVMFAQNNKDRYPMPSILDPDGLTLAGDAAAKDTTANIMSVLIYNGFFGPELCVSPAEANGSIKQMTTYAYSNPATAVNPAKALWDPAFSADFTGGRTGNFSYAHQAPTGLRLGDWANTFSATTVAVGNRGPAVSGVTYGRDPLGAQPAFDAKSNTLMIHGARSTWEGNIAYADNHVNFETRMDPVSMTYVDSAGAKWADCLFFDEPADVNGRNAFMSIWTKAGATPADFGSIWD